MTLTLELPSALERELSAEAERLGLSLDEYALQVLATRSGSSNSPRTGAELVAFWQSRGVIGARPDLPDDAPAYARQLRAEAERRHHD
ncbi:MAG TPA: hypothetical protein VFS20_31435 [Longimicrobium sp.]|nr:hypothetical protein [Longimicrobium sp.]